jgi:hypothetical protein
MKIWTIQPIEVMNIINETGAFVCDIGKSHVCDCKQIFKAYDWLVEQMEKRVGKKPKGVAYPIWAWYKVDGENKKPDLRKRDFQYFPAGTQCVCIELELNEEEVLLSDEPNWTCYILNDLYFDVSLTEEEWFKEQVRFDKLPKEKREQAKLDSWKNVFDVELFENDWLSKGKYVQATFWKIRKEDIRDIRYFKSRNIV